MAVNPIPAGYHTVTPYLIVKDAAKALSFYIQAFGAVEIMRMADKSGKVGHAEIRIGDSILMLADEFPDMGFLSPLSLGGTATGLSVYVPDADTRFTAAVEAGAKVLKPMKDEFYGDRSGQIIDPFGHKWTIATHIEDVTPEEMNRRYEALMQG